MRLKEVKAYTRRIPVTHAGAVIVEETLMVEVEPHVAVSASFLQLSAAELKAAKEGAKRAD